MPKHSLPDVDTNGGGRPTHSALILCHTHTPPETLEIYLFVHSSLPLTLSHSLSISPLCPLRVTSDVNSPNQIVKRLIITDQSPPPCPHPPPACVDRSTVVHGAQTQTENPTHPSSVGFPRPPWSCAGDLRLPVARDPWTLRLREQRLLIRAEHGNPGRNICSSVIAWKGKPIVSLCVCVRAWKYMIKQTERKGKWNKAEAYGSGTRRKGKAWGKKGADSRIGTLEATFCLNLSRTLRALPPKWKRTYNITHNIYNHACVHNNFKKN